MAWTSMHFATGMAGSTLIASAAYIIFRKPPRHLPFIATAGGLFAIIPDLPRIWREDFPSLPLASVLGQKPLERSLHTIGDFFFFHATLDEQPREYALHGLALVIFLYLITAIISHLTYKHQHNELRRQIKNLTHHNHAKHIKPQSIKSDNQSSQAHH